MNFSLVNFLNTYTFSLSFPISLYLVFINSNLNFYWLFNFLLTYRRVASSNMSGLEPHPGFHRLFMKGILKAYVPWLFDKKIFFESITNVIILANLRYLGLIIFGPSVKIPALVQFGETCVFVAILSSV